MQQITIAGRIGKDATRNTTQSGDVVANFSVAVDTRGQNKVTNWWRCRLVRLPDGARSLRALAQAGGR